MIKRNIHKVIGVLALLIATIACSLFASSPPKLPNYGVYLVDDNSYVELNQYTGAPKEKNIRSELENTFSNPVFLVWLPQIDLQYFLLVSLDVPGHGIQYKITPRDDDGEILEIVPSNPLSDGAHCFVQGDPFGAPFSLPYWCFLVQNDSDGNSPSTSKEIITPTSIYSNEPIQLQPTVAISNDDGLLSQILNRGIIVIATDPNYYPQSRVNTSGERSNKTKCENDQLTAGELLGFDIDVAVTISMRLGVEPCFVAPPWDHITAGAWGDGWDISIGSMNITPEREQVLFFTTPYYFDGDGKPMGIAIDRMSSLPAENLAKVVDQIVKDMHADGTLSELSYKWYEKDLTK